MVVRNRKKERKELETREALLNFFSIVQEIKSLTDKHELKQDILEEIFTKKTITLFQEINSSFPDYILNTPRLSALESIVKFLKENKELSFTAIGEQLNRDHRTIWTTYQSSIKKQSARFEKKQSELLIPLSIIKNRNLGVQEQIVKYLKEECELNYHQIALKLNRDERTIWTAYSRVKKKEKNNKKN